MTKSTDDRSSIFKVDVIRPRAASAASLVMRSLDTSLSSSLSMVLMVSWKQARGHEVLPTRKLQALIKRALGTVDQGHWNLSFLGSDESNSETLTIISLFYAWVCAGQQTICPAPITPSDLTSAARTAGDVLNAREPIEGPLRQRMWSEGKGIVKMVLNSGEE